MLKKEDNYLTLIKEKETDIINEFKDNKIFSNKYKEETIELLFYDQLNYPYKDSFNYKEIIKTKKIKEYTYSDTLNDSILYLGINLINGYKSITSEVKQDFRKDFFQKKDRCPVCGRILQKSSKTSICNADLDHFLPKSIYPQFSLFADNLIPICKDCNQVEKKDQDIDITKLKTILKEKSPKEFSIFNEIHYDFEKRKVKLISDKKGILLSIYGLNERYSFACEKLYNNLFNLIKYHNINTPEALETFLESCLSANMQEMVSDFSLNNYPKLWNDFIDYVLYDYNNLSALWEELREYNKLQFYI
ncbi:MAG: HNH endonuclease signature motif containing protein [Alphaproteobacteria bacterium]